MWDYEEYEDDELESVGIYPDDTDYPYGFGEEDEVGYHGER